MPIAQATAVQHEAVLFEEPIWLSSRVRGPGAERHAFLANEHMTMS